MGKSYYCDFCERSFADGAENRKKHLASVHHQKLRKAHYDQFKDPATILEESKQKRPCRKFHSEGFCEFGNGCIYSHLTLQDVQRLHEQVRLGPLMSSSSSKPISSADLDEWLRSKSEIQPDTQTPVSLATDAAGVLPAALAGIVNLPPSLLPFQRTVGKEKNTAQWG